MAEQKDAFAQARDEGFTAGTIAALAVVTAMDCSVTWKEIVQAAGMQQVLQHALTNEGDWEWAGFKRYAANELGRAEVAKARRAVRAARARGAALPSTPVAEVRTAMVLGKKTTRICALVDGGSLSAGTLLYAHPPAGVKASGLPAWVDGLRDFMERNGKTTEEIGNVLVAAGFATRGVTVPDHQTNSSKEK